MRAHHYPFLLIVAGLLAQLLAGCGGDDEDEAICDQAFEAFCACPMVSCSGQPESCTGPDKTWAECINAAPDPCNANCPP